MEDEKPQKRPMLTDPKEFAIVRAMYFEDTTNVGTDGQPLPQEELNDRIEHSPNRNQSR